MDCAYNPDYPIACEDCAYAFECKVYDEVARLRALCAARPKLTPMQEDYWRNIQPDEFRWFDKIDAAGRGEGGR